MESELNTTRVVFKETIEQLSFLPWIGYHCQKLNEPGKLPLYLSNQGCKKQIIGSSGLESTMEWAYAVDM